MKKLAIALLFVGAVGYGQSFETTAGGSQMYGNLGAQTDYKWGKYSGWTGVGYGDSIRFGGFLTTSISEQARLGIGDQRLSGYLDTDEYETHSFTVRGVDIVAKGHIDNRLEVFSGFLTQEQVQPYLHFASLGAISFTDTPLGAIIYRRKLAKFQIHSINLISPENHTSIQSFGWKPSPAWNIAGAAGLGSGSAYFAAAGEHHTRRLDLRASYTLADQNFHRQEGLVSTEPLGLNARIEYAPFNLLKINYSHEHSLTYLSPYPTTIDTYDSGGVRLQARGFQFSASDSVADVVGFGATTLQMASLSKKITSRWKSFISDVKMNSPGLKNDTLVAINEYKVNSHLKVRQNYNRMNGQNSFTCGGQWISNRVSFNIDNQVYVSPLAQAFGGKTVFQAWTFSIRVRVPHGLNANVDTTIDPSGRTRLGGYLSGLRYSAVEPYHEAPSHLETRYIIQGRVIDTERQPVWGIAVQVGDETVYSDSNGEFFVHVKTNKPVSVAVVAESSLQSAPWKLQSAPAIAQGWLDGSVSDPVVVVVQLTRTKG